MVESVIHVLTDFTTESDVQSVMRLGLHEDVDLVVLIPALSIDSGIDVAVCHTRHCSKQ